MDAALRILGVRDHSRLELEQKLQARHFSADQIFDVLNRLEEYGYVDDAKFAALFVKSHQDKGRKGLERALTQKGIAPEIAGSLLEDMTEEDEFGRALEAAQRRYSPQDVLSLPRDTFRRRLNGFLGRRGFSASTSFSVCTHLEAEANAEGHD